jgi:hypothetical protein
MRAVACALRFFYMHALVYVTVNAMLITINLVTSPHRPWSGGPLMGWGSRWPYTA